MFESPPFLQCPSCRKEKSFGVLGIHSRGYTRKCSACSHAAHYKLPQLKKTVIYLDQFVISNIAKVLDPKKSGKRGHPDGDFYCILFGKLDRLIKLQLIVCPYSEAHVLESTLVEEFEQYKLIWEHLANGKRLLPRDSIFCRQVENAFEKWHTGEHSDSIELGSENIYPGDMHDWLDRLRISFVHPKSAELEAEQRINRTLRSEHLARVFQAWRGEDGRSYSDWLEEELTGAARAFIAEQMKFLTSFAAIINNPESESVWDFVGNVQGHLAMRLLKKLGEGISDPAATHRAFGAFLTSSAFRDIPKVRLEATMWAGLAHLIHNDPKMTYPKESIANDIHTISTYLPYVDSMFIDNQCRYILTHGPVKGSIPYHTELYSHSCKNAFIAYLDKLEEDSTREHKALVDSVYGENWLKPYWNIVADYQKAK